MPGPLSCKWDCSQRPLPQAQWALGVPKGIRSFFLQTCSSSWVPQLTGKHHPWANCPRPIMSLLTRLLLLSAWHSNNGHVLSALPPCHLWNWLLRPHPEEPLPCQVWTAADKASGDPQPSVSAQPCSAVDTPVSGLHAFAHAVPPSLHVLPSSTAARKRLLSPAPSMSQGVPDKAELGE